MVQRYNSSALEEPLSPASPYKLGAPIELPELLALPPDGNCYTRDDQGQLALMSPDNWRRHGTALVILARLLTRRLLDPYWVLQERSVAFPRVFDLKGHLLRESFLGPKAIAPDIAVFGQRPGDVESPRGEGLWVAPAHVRLVIELLSDGTWRSDLGLGEADAVDRQRTYLESGVPEYWTLNAAVEDSACPLLPRSGRFRVRSADGRGSEELPVVDGRVRSRAVPELELDLEAYWRECEG